LLVTVLSDVAIARAALSVFTAADAVVAVAIALAESGGNPEAHNPVPPDDSWGLWQINMRGALGPDRRAKLGLTRNAELTDPAVCARAAALVKREQGWDAWSVYLHKTHVQYLTRAQVAVAQARGAQAPGQRIGRLLTQGCQGDDVRAVQRLVGAHADGVYGPETAERVRRWQGLHHLDSDGVFGPASTRAAGWTWTGTTVRA
jgi:peptidoglycan hydrolase-like protein with peptidoglycan-binding domain